MATESAGSAESVSNVPFDANLWAAWIQDTEEAGPVGNMSQVNFDNVEQMVEEPLFEDEQFYNDLIEFGHSADIIRDYLAIVLGADWENYHSPNNANLIGYLKAYTQSSQKYDALPETATQGRRIAGLRTKDYAEAVFGALPYAFNDIRRTEESLRVIKKANEHAQQLQDAEEKMRAPETQQPPSIEAASIRSAISVHRSELDEDDINAIDAMMGELFSESDYSVGQQRRRIADLPDIPDPDLSRVTAATVMTTMAPDTPSLRSGQSRRSTPGSATSRPVTQQVQDSHTSTRPNSLARQMSVASPARPTVLTRFSPTVQLGTPGATPASESP